MAVGGGECGRPAWWCVRPCRSHVGRFADRETGVLGGDLQATWNYASEHGVFRGRFLRLNEWLDLTVQGWIGDVLEVAGSREELSRAEQLDV